jgi:glycosyltransferase involved in cell wall biosynthesis
MAYNEENNIVQILHALLNQNLDIAHIKEIVVVASGCTDQTVPLAQAIAQTHPLIKVEVQTE